jgi:ABC-type uncharacterized transport system substrate-binding protein
MKRKEVRANGVEVEVADESRHATACVDRVLKGEKPAGLPMQGSTKYELVINPKTAKALESTAPARNFCCTAYVRFWHKADIT